MRVLRDPRALLVQTHCFKGDEKIGAQYGFREPNIPFLSFFGSQSIQRNVKWVPYQLKPDPSEAEKGLHSRVTGGWKLVVTKPFHVRVLETLPLSSCSCDPGSYPQVLFLLNPVGSIFFLILEVVSILPLNLFFSLRDSRVCFRAFQQRT